MGKLLSNEQIKGYAGQGYLALPGGPEGMVSAQWLDRLNAETQAFIEASRTAEPKDKRFDCEPDHRADSPRLRRLNSPVDLSEVYWEFASQGPFADIAEDLLGPNVKFHHSKLNFKWAQGGEEVKWHQDIQFWPHTNYDIVTLGVYLSDVDESMSPMGVIPGSHAGELFELYDDQDRWTGNIAPSDLPRVDAASASYIQGPAGTITAHHCRAIHGSGINLSAAPRPLLLCAYSAADAIPITTLTAGGRHSEETVRGEPARWARFDGRPCPMPPDWSKKGGYKSIFEHQQND